MSTILVQIFNIGFKSVTIVKASSGATIDRIEAGQPSKTFGLIDNSNSVQISAASLESATVSLEGGEVVTPVSVQGVGDKKDLYNDDPLTLLLRTSTILVLKPADPPVAESAGSLRAAVETDSANGVKCGEVIILPEPS